MPLEASELAAYIATEIQFRGEGDNNYYLCVIMIVACDKGDRWVCSGMWYVVDEDW